MSRKNNWACSACGMLSGRRYSIQRHIDNKNIHEGKATIIPIAQYLAGVNSGTYNPSIDSIVNTERKKLGHDGLKHKPAAAARTNGSSDAGNGTEIIHRKLLERLGDLAADDMTNNWKEQPAEYKAAVIALAVKDYDRAAAGTLDLVAAIEKFLVESGQLKFLQSTNSSNRGNPSATTHNEVSEAKQNASRTNTPAEFTSGDTEVSPTNIPKILNMKIEVEKIRRQIEARNTRQRMTLDIKKIRELLGKKGHEKVTPIELGVGCAKSSEILKIVSKY